MVNMDEATTKGFKCACGGTGRHGGLKHRCFLKVCRFKSDWAYEEKKKKWFNNEVKDV
jgi:hypothetical protein